MNKNAIQYDHELTASCLEESQFIIHGFHEEWRQGGKLLTTIHHDAIPQGQKLGGDINNDYIIEEDVTVTNYNKKTKLKKGDVVSRCFMPICGRIKP